MEGIVIDTNVFVAAGFNPRSASARILTGLREGRFRLIWNEPTRRETEMILRRIPRLDWEKGRRSLPTGREIYWVGRSRRLRTDHGPRRSKIRSAERIGEGGARHE